MASLTSPPPETAVFEERFECFRFRHLGRECIIVGTTPETSADAGFCEDRKDKEREREREKGKKGGFLYRAQRWLGRRGRMRMKEEVQKL